MEPLSSRVQAQGRMVTAATVPAMSLGFLGGWVGGWVDCFVVFNR